MISNENEYIVRAETPVTTLSLTYNQSKRLFLQGMTKEDLSVKLEEDMLTLSGEKKVEAEHKKEDYKTKESWHGKFSRSIQVAFKCFEAQMLCVSFNK